MSDEAERIRRQMQNVRQEVGDDVKGIVQDARQLSDWRHYVRRYPWACVGSAFALGFLATPARRKLVSADVEKVFGQLRASGVVGAATSIGPLAGGGLAGKLLAVAGPILLRNAASLVAKKFSGGHPPANNPAPGAVAP